MTFLLDTNACIRFLNGTSDSLKAQLQARPPSDSALCSVVKAELLFGAHNSARISENLRTLAEFFAPFASFPFDDAAAEVYGTLRSELASRGELIGPNDLLIASIAQANDLTLVTHNVREFERVPQLEVVDWEGGS